MTEHPLTPLLDPAGPLDERQRAVVTRVAEAEYAKILSLPTDDPLDAKRRYRVEVTRDELVAQPQAIESTWARNIDELESLAERLAAAAPRRAFLVGAGDSLAVMVAARDVLELALGIPCEPVQSLDLAYYRGHLLDNETLVIALSSSGETTRTVEAALVAQHAAALTVALTNTPGSSLDQECDTTFVIEATRVGWPTQASTAALALLYRLGVEVAKQRGVTAVADLEPVLLGLPQRMAEVAATHEAAVAKVAEDEHTKKMYLFSGGGPSWACAIIGSAKVRECSPDHAQSIQVEEFHHYNSQKEGEPIWVIAPEGPSVARAVDTVRDARRYGGTVYVVTTVGVDRFDGLADLVLQLPAVPEMLSPMLTVIPVQMFGHHVAMAKFRAAERSQSS